jgi:hypothetical protein
MFTVSNADQIETLFSDMEPENIAGEPFTPSLHDDDLILDEEAAETETEQEVTELNEAQLGPFTPFNTSDIPIPLAAVDVGVIDLGMTTTGFALAFKGAIISQDINGSHTLLKVGPKYKFIAPDNRAEILRFIGCELMNEEMFVDIHADGSLSIKAGAREPNQFKDRIRNFIERMLQLDIVQQLQNGIMLVDGTLTLRTYNTPQVFLERLGRESARGNSDIIGVSKKSRITVNGVQVTALLDDAPLEAGYKQILAEDTEGREAEIEDRNLGIPYAIRFSPGGYTFRVDVARKSVMPDEDAVLAALYANTQMTLGYPNLLRLAHIHSAFTKAEILALQVQAAYEKGISMRPPEDLSVIFAPFRKGIG